MLGYLNPEALAGGTVPIQAGLARRAIEERIARPLGRDLLETAYGMHTVANANMMKAVKAVTTYRGRDPRDFSLLAFGGNGGVHAVDLARVLQIGKVILPLAAGVFSAVGLLFSKLEVNETAPFLHRAATLPLDEAERAYQALAQRIAGIIGGERARHHVPAPGRSPLCRPGLRADRALARRAARSSGGRRALPPLRGRPSRALRARVLGRVPGRDRQSAPGRLRADRKVSASSRHEAGEATRERGERQAYFGPGLGRVATPVLDRDAPDATSRAGVR